MIIYLYKMSEKRKFTQNDLRKAMIEHKKKIGSIKKIQSPLAKYTDLGQLKCILCNCIVSSEAVWPVHLNCKIHKEKITFAKQTRLDKNQEISKSDISLRKRPLPPHAEETINKKVKSILIHASNLLDQTKVTKEAQQYIFNPVHSITLQTNLKDKPIKNNNKNENFNDTKCIVLPEGFFDDPIMDAKARNVEYKDPKEEEWEKFQKEIKEETIQSAQIIADDEEVATTERQLDEIEEQIQHWSRVMDLVKKKELFQTANRNEDMTDDDPSSNDETDFDEFLDWRKKKSYI
ncbi:zinc finger protein 830 [Prorops nasuta]|uniref:zinc finger protein 830 n=1 Tax=Prorops nasuta TaxID=863751 RepID=UPI0034CF0DFA